MVPRAFTVSGLPAALGEAWSAPCCLAPLSLCSGAAGLAVWQWVSGICFPGGAGQDWAVLSTGDECWSPGLPGVSHVPRPVPPPVRAPAQEHPLFCGGTPGHGGGGSLMFTKVRGRQSRRLCSVGLR